jgi:5-methylcytosine-specific restriction endonuclease McrA
MPGSFCTVCRARIPKGSRCSKHAIRSPSNKAWHRPGATRLRARVLSRDDHRCVRCGSTEELSVHHIVPARHGGSDDLLNLQLLCADCHRVADRMTDYTRDLFPEP